MFSPTKIKQEEHQTVADIKLQPKSLSELLAVAGHSRLQEDDGGNKKRLMTKLLMNVTIQRSLGVIKVVISPEKTVEDLIENVLEIYLKERRRPLLSETNPGCFELHYTQFNLKSLDREEKLMNLGSRNFFLCPRTSETIISSCSDEVKQAANSYFQLPRFMDFFL
ncbi:hypothetical protein AQUCO_01300602v1 [Aquilegia coerulea]|uniref:DUF7054 domain-containing protein n=1 Tax=Aquilegia coerulea TaxID=218851 RepID=A0A2G5E2I5_AQUCA|nr:hypothetical protein AQUCO_01300602v1 [Aquilegia coerulea]